MKAGAIIGAGLLAASAVFGEAPSPGLDTIFLTRGEQLVGRATSLDEKSLKVQKRLPSLPGARPDAPPMFATVTIARGEIDRIEFAPNPALDRELEQSTDPVRLEALWKQAAPWLEMPKSSAGRIGCAFGEVLLRANDPGNAQRALELFQMIERDAWSDDDRTAAAQGRLRAMVATGNAAGAVQEAAELAARSEDPAVLIEAKFVLATAADAAFRKLVEDNPRWNEDIFVIPERNRLYNEALDLYLFPSLFHGSDADPAARGVWGAVGVYQFAGETGHAVERARDVVAIYPGTKYASLARKFLDGLPEEARKQDNEKEARAEAGEKPKAP